MATLTTIKRGALEATISSAGAELQSLKLDGREYLWQGDSRWWPRRAPVLFPFVGNIRDDRATSAEGPIALGRHGLARTLEHTVVDPGRGHVTYELLSSEATRALYPYDFRLSMTYDATSDALEQRFIVTNTGKAPLPFCVGGHPAFNVPVEGSDEDFADYSLSFARRWTYAAPTLDTSTGLLEYGNRFPVLDNESKLHLTHELFDVDTIVFENVPDRIVTLVGREGHGVEVSFDGFDYLGVWSAPNAPFVAIEPWTGTATAADDVETFEN